MDPFNLPDNWPKRAASACRALGDPTRLRIVLLLGRGPRTVSDLTAVLRMRQPNVSQHLAVLRAAGLLAPRREGKHQLYGLTDNLHLAPAADVTLSVQVEGVRMQFHVPRSPGKRARPGRE